LTLLERLKTETRPAHDRIEQVVDIESRLTSLVAYRSLLARFYGFHAVWEPRAAALIADPDFFEPRRKTALLAQDLKYLGLSERDLEDLPRCAPLMPMADAASAYGALYVVEGSTLGGTIIGRQVERHLGLTPGAGCSYFRSYGPALGPMWKAFGGRLLALSRPGFDEGVVESANRTFETMRIWLSREPSSGTLEVAEAAA
jgi:heme oxygenase